MSEDRVIDALNAFYGKDFGQYHSEIREAMTCLLEHGKPARASLSSAPQVTNDAVNDALAVWFESDSFVCGPEPYKVMRRVLEQFAASAPAALCSDCPPTDYPTDKTRCLPCPRRASAPAGSGEWVMVPREATEAMLDAYWHQAGESKEMRARTHTSARRYYAEMIAAAPAPSAVEDAVKAERDWLDAAASLYDRCKLFPESSEDGMVALLELRSLVFAAIRARKP